MKKNWTIPGFELIFSLTLIVIMAVPPLVFAQDSKTMEIRINNGDTTINGKNIKDLSVADKKQALKDINNLGPLKGRMSGRGNGTLRDIVIERREMSDTGHRRGGGMRFENRDGDHAMARRDTAERVFRLRMKRQNGKDSVFSFNYRRDDDRMMNDDREMRLGERGPEFRMRGSGREFFHRRNVQNLDYTNTGSDGITTHVSFRISDASPEKMKETTGAEKSGLEIKDLNLVPEFSSGKTLMMFSLPAHTPAEVKLIDNEGKVVWTDKALNGSFTKSFGLGLNGVYYLQVKQTGKIVVKRIVKEE